MCSAQLFGLQTTKIEIRSSTFLGSVHIAAYQQSIVSVRAMAKELLGRKIVKEERKQLS
jgi:hypothetical protein